MAALVDTLDVPGRVFALIGNVDYGPRESALGIGIDRDRDLLASPNLAHFGLRHVNLDPQVVGAEDANHRSIRRYQISLANAHHFDDSALRRPDIGFGQV